LRDLTEQPGFSERFDKMQASAGRILAEFYSG